LTDPKSAALALLVFALAFSPGAVPAAPKSTSPAPAATSTELPTFRADTSAIEADDQLQWSIPLQVQNRFPVGVYIDSLTCEVENLDPGEPPSARRSMLELSHIVREASASAGESHAFTFTAPAIAEHARLTFRIGLYRADKRRTSLTTVVEALPGPVTRDHPSQFLTVDGRRVEYVLFPAGRDSQPGLVLVHGHGSHARRMLRNALRIAPRGYTVMLVSMPGYGQSEGSPDWMGPATVRALSAALDRLEAEPGVNPKRIAAWGVSRGAGAVARFAQERADLAAAIAESGTYDLWAIWRAAASMPERQAAIVRDAGADSAAWRARSAALQPKNPSALLVLHGEKDPLAPVAQARGFAESLKARGAEVESRYFPNSGHDLPPAAVMQTALDFLERRLRR
jgi:dipeptidyl aminopeptidase/acylaminoacyl peptidase